MGSTIFSSSHPPIKPPAYCKSLIEDLPPALPPTGPIELQGFANWTDLDPLGPLDISMYAPMSRTPPAWIWSGAKTVEGTLFVITLERLTDPNPWELRLDVWRTPTAHEWYAWPPFNMNTAIPWETPLLTQTVLPGKDYRSAQAMF